MSATSTGNLAATWPWVELPREIADLMRPHLDSVAAEMVNAIQNNIPAFARPRDDTYGHNIRAGIEQAIHQFVEMIENPDSPREEFTKFYRALGRGEVQEGRSLDSLQAAYRLGARVAWRRFAEFCERVELAPHTICLLAEAFFIYIDELAAASAEGYTRAQARLSGEIQRRRRRLLDLLLAEPAASPQAIADLAGVAEWRVPETVSVVALDDSSRQEEQSDELLSPLSLSSEILVDLERQQPCLIVPDPDTSRHTKGLEHALRGWRCALGPAVAPAEAAQSLRWACHTLALARRGAVTGDGMLRCADHLATLVVLRDEELIETLAAKRLAPLAHLRPLQQERLAETLLAWLQNGRNAAEVGVRLYVHPQTVRYRLRQLEQLFGDQLRDPDRGFELELVLRARLLLGWPRN